MAPTDLNGLNIIQPPKPAYDSSDLLPGQEYADLSQQLDLWTNLPFDSDEAGAVPDPTDLKKSNDLRQQHSQQQQQSPVFDLQSILAGIAIPPYLAHPLRQPPQPVQPMPGAAVPSLAQILALHSAQVAMQNSPIFPQHQHQQPSQFSADQSPQLSSPSDSSSSPPAPKRSRTRKSSVSTVADSPSDTGTLSIAEDKRRRNTAASARFRLKKKEREAALESKAKELETKVNELERECESLRRENGWLRGLVVGVTGAASAANVNSAAASGVPTPLSLKRPREDDS